VCSVPYAVTDCAGGRYAWSASLACGCVRCRCCGCATVAGGVGGRLGYGCDERGPWGAALAPRGCGWGAEGRVAVAEAPENWLKHLRVTDYPNRWIRIRAGPGLYGARRAPERYRGDRAAVQPDTNLAGRGTHAVRVTSGAHSVGHHRDRPLET